MFQALPQFFHTFPPVEGINNESCRICALIFVLVLMKNHSIFSLVRNALSYHENWPKAWRSPHPKTKYDVVIVGAGGHGLATAYYLAKEHGISNVAVLEKGWLGGGSVGRNTTIVRSNYLWD